MDHAEQMNERYRSIRIPRARYQRVLMRITVLAGCGLRCGDDISADKTPASKSEDPSPEIKPNQGQALLLRSVCYALARYQQVYVRPLDFSP